MPTKKTSKLEKASNIISVVAGIITALAIAFSGGYWKCKIDRRLDAMEQEQRHNEEIANLKIEHNRQLMETRAELNNTILQLQTEIQFLKAKNNGKR